MLMKEQLRRYQNKERKALRDNLDDEQKEHLKIEENKEKKKSMIILILMKKNS